MSTLSDNNIYRLPLKEALGREDLELVYAPVAGNMMVVSHEEGDAIEHAVADYPNTELKEIVDSLIDGIPACQRDSKVNNVDDFLLMYILPNYICNFSCSYCFSAHGRSKKALKKEHLKAALDYFIDSSRVQSKRLAISYLGGGEPTISWDLVKFGLEYADELAQRHGIELMTTIVTNGSRITREMIDTFSRYNVMARVSFEILPDIQNLQRGQYDNVCKGLDLLSGCTRRPMVRSMITPDNVCRLCEMVEALHKRFPFIKEVLFDPITSSETFHDVDFTRKFYSDYYDNFISARQLGKKYDIDVACAPLRNLNMVVERFCTGEFCLTPEGTITVCHQISSPNEDNYFDYIYAHVDDENRLIINNDKFRRLSTTNTIYTNPNCRDCYIKWNCGGGCMMQNNQYLPEILDVICEFTRRFSLTLLVERLSEQFASEGLSLADYIKENYD